MRSCVGVVRRALHHGVPIAAPFALLLAVGLAGCTERAPRAGSGDWAFDTTGFRTVMIRSNGAQPAVDGDSREGIAAARAQRLPYVEVDLLLTKDSVLVTAHDLNLGGTCGDVRERTWAELASCTLDGGRHVASLDELLEAGFVETFLDLKTGLDQPELNAVAVARAVAAVQRADASGRAVLMIYGVTPELAATVRGAGVRAGAKGYPDSDSTVRALIDLAAAHGLEMLCSEARFITPEHVRYATSRGVWLLPWDLRGPAGVAHAKALAAAGIGGMITRDVALIDAHVRPAASLRRSP